MASPSEARPVAAPDATISARLLHVMAEATTVQEVSRRVVEVVGETLGWDVVTFWAFDEAAGVLRCTEMWHSDAVSVDEFEAVTREARFPPGVGLPGRVWASREPAWVVDVVHDDNFPRAAVAAREGLHGGFALPVPGRDRLLGVIEVLAADARQPDATLLDALATMGSEVGHFLHQRMVEDELHRERQRLAMALDAAQMGVWEWDLETGRVVWSDALEALFGVPPGAFKGTFEDFAERIHPDDRHEVVTAIQAALDAEAGHRVEHRVIWPDGSIRWIEGKGRVVRDERGRITGMAGVAMDVTDRKRADEERAALLAAERAARAQAESARQQLAFLAEAGALLAASLDYRVTLERVARLAVPRLADWCVVHATETPGEITAVDTVVIAHPDPERERLGRELLERYPFDPTLSEGAALAMRTGEALLYREIDDDLLQRAARSDDHLAALRALGFRSAMVVPLVARGRTLGAVTLATAESGRIYGPDDLALAEMLARRAALAVDNARLFLDRSEVARALQQSLLPPHLPDVPGLELAARFLPGHEGLDIGGDFYDVFSTGPDEWVVVIGDVCGTGAEAAALTGVVRHTLRAAAMQERTPSRMLALLNEALLREDRGERFCTVACLRVVMAGGRARLLVCAGGHPLPMLVRPDREVVELQCTGTLLGVVDDPVLSDHEAELAPGEALVLYTDGVTEARCDGVMFGEDRLADVVRSLAGRPAAVLAQGIETAVVRYGGGVADDVAILVLRVPEATEATA